MRLADLVAPIASSHRDDVQLGVDDCSSDGSGNFLRDLGTQPHVSIVISNCDDGLESCTLSGTSLLLNWRMLIDELRYGVENSLT